MKNKDYFLNMNLDWKIPEISDIKFLQTKMQNFDFQGNDCSLANLFLLQNRYDTEIAITTNCLFRKYFSKNLDLLCYGFPLPFLSDNNNLNNLKLLLEKHKKLYPKIPLRFCFADNKQTQILSNFFHNSKIQTSISSSPKDFDYIYSQSDLSLLKGKKYQKKRNHISKFLKSYSNYEFLLFNSENFNSKAKNDITKVLETWNSENEINKSVESEICSISSALSNFSDLNLFAGVLYTDNKPCGMTIASSISKTTVDILFEKCINSIADNGGYTFLCQNFSKHLTNFEFINREEDLGLEGLRKSKLSYMPEYLLEKNNIIINFDIEDKNPLFL